MNTKTLVIFAMAVSTPLWCAGTSPEFEVASLKALRSGESSVPVMTGGPGTATPTRVRYSGRTLCGLIANALEINCDQVLGPLWIREDKYLLEAVMPRETSEAQFKKMLWTLLAGRFAIRTHHERREFTVYSLVVMPGGPKLLTSSASDDGETGDWDGVSPTGPVQSGIFDSEGCPIRPRGSRGASGRIGKGDCRAYRRYTMEHLARDLEILVAIDNLAYSAHVVNRTGINGEFDFNLKYNEFARILMKLPKSPNLPKFPDAPLGPGLPESLRTQLGLNLEKTKEWLDVLVIDQASRTPSEN